MILQFFAPIFGGIVLTLLLIPFGIRLARSLNLLDEPHSAPHKTHQTSVPKAGGLVIFAAVFLVNLWGGNLQDPETLSILLGSIIIMIFGLWDDARGLSASWKLTGQFLAAALLIWQGVYIRMLLQPVPNIAVTLLWIAGITNAFNLVDSMDGLAAGLAAIASAFFLFVTIDAGQLHLTFLSATLLGACIGLFYFNTTPARTFLGDSGAQFLGFMLATLAMAYTPPGLPQPSSWFVPILLLFVPIFDTALVSFTRLQRGIPIYKAGQDHIYHRLVQVGNSPAQAVTVMHVAAILSGCLAFIALQQPPLLANAIFALTMLSGLIALVWLVKVTPVRSS